MMINSYARKAIKDCLKYYEPICDAIEKGRAELKVKKRRRFYIIKIDKFSGWIICVMDFLANEKNKLARELFDKMYIENQSEQWIIRKYSISRGSDIFDKIYHLGIGKGLVDYEDILKDEINR